MAEQKRLEAQVQELANNAQNKSTGMRM